MPQRPLEPIARSICQDRRLTYVRAVGSGAFKETFHVQDSRGVSFALKLYRLPCSQNRSLREIQAIQTCSHPHIARLVAVDSHRVGKDEFLYCIEDFLSGGTLGKRLEREGPLAREEVLRTGRALVDAVSHIASHSLVHRDIKPENILLHPDRHTPVLVDFGLVRFLGRTSLTPTWNLQGPGTPLYASPEQLNNDKTLIDWRSDQYGLGITLSICAFGFHPYAEQGMQDHEIVSRVAQRGPLALRFQNAVVDHSLSCLVRMVAPWPVQRYRLPSELSREWETM